MRQVSIRSNSTPDLYHDVHEEGGEWSCDCTGYQVKGTCTHIRRAKADIAGEKTLNEYLIRITHGMGIIGKPLSIDEDVTLVVHGTVVKESKHTNNDGTYDIVFEVKASLVTDLSELKEKQHDGQIRIQD